MTWFFKKTKVRDGTVKRTSLMLKQPSEGFFKKKVFMINFAELTRKDL